MEIATRKVCVAGCTTNPDELSIKQMGGNLTDAEDGFLNGKRYILMDRDGKFSPAFKEILKSEGVKPVSLPPKSPKRNASDLTQPRRLRGWQRDVFVAIF